MNRGRDSAGESIRDKGAMSQESSGIVTAEQAKNNTTRFGQAVGIGGDSSSQCIVAHLSIL